MHLCKLFADSLSLNPLPCILGSRQNLPGFSNAQHSLPAAFSPSLFWDPQAENDELLAEGAATGAPVLHTWDTEHALPLLP